MYVNLLALIASKANIAIDWKLCEWITRNDKREQKDGDSKTHHLDDVQSFFNTGDEDDDDDVADAQPAALRLIRSLI